MADVYHNWGNDFQWSASGDLAMVSGAEEGRQGVLRRILTGPTTYIFDLPYGAGLPGAVGTVDQPPALQAMTLTQMLMENVVLQNPPPSVKVTPLPISEGSGGYAIDIGYTDASTGDPVYLGFDVSN